MWFFLLMISISPAEATSPGSAGENSEVLVEIVDSEDDAAEGSAAEAGPGSAPHPNLKKAETAQLQMKAMAENLKWDCGEAEWHEKPEMDDGVFKAAVKMQCKVTKENCRGFEYLSQYIRQLVQSERKLHGSPVNGTFENLPSITFDTSHRITDDGNNIRIRENVLIATDQKTRLYYQTNSTDVEAEGMADYLVKVDFSADIKVTDKKSEYSVFMINRVHVDRPWYAFSPIFYLIAKGVTKDKFAVARNRIMPHLMDNL